MMGERQVDQGALFYEFSSLGLGQSSSHATISSVRRARIRGSRIPYRLFTRKGLGGDAG